MWMRCFGWWNRENYIGAAEQHIAKLLEKSRLPVILVINKIDKVRREELPACVQMYEKLGRFEEILTVSALRGLNLEKIIDALFRFLPYGPQFFDADTVTDQPVRQIAAEMIREKALRSLGEEVPHGIAVVIESMKERPEGGLTDVEATIICERDSHKGIIIGKQGAMLKKIGSEARPEIEKLLETRVNLKLWVKVRKDWRDSDLLVKNYGYDKKDLS